MTVEMAALWAETTVSYSAAMWVDKLACSKGCSLVAQLAGWMDTSWADQLVARWAERTAVMSVDVLAAGKAAL